MLGRVPIYDMLRSDTRMALRFTVIPLCHITFDLCAGFSQVGEVLGVSLLEARLVAVRPVGDAVSGDGIEQFVVQAQAGALRPVRLAARSPVETLPRFGWLP